MTAGGNNLGQRIAEERAGRSLSQRALAALVGVSQPTVNRWESGKDRPSFDAMFRLCDVLELDPASFANGGTSNGSEAS